VTFGANGRQLGPARQLSLAKSDDVGYIVGACAKVEDEEEGGLLWVEDVDHLFDSWECLQVTWD